MAKFKHGESTENLRMHIVNAQENKGENGTQVHASISISNDMKSVGRPNGRPDYKDKVSVIQADPMLMYAQRGHRIQNTKPSYSFDVMYEKDEWDSIMENANHEGDKPVFNADIEPITSSVNGIKSDGFRVKTDTIKNSKKEEPFKQERHVANTNQRREYDAEIKANARIEQERHAEKMKELGTDSNAYGPDM